MRSTECPDCIAMPESMHAAAHRLSDRYDDVVDEIRNPLARLIARHPEAFMRLAIGCVVILVAILIAAALGIIPTYPSHTPCCQWWPF